MKNKSKSILASMGMLFTAIIWGFAFVVVKDVVSTVSPIYMLAFRFTIASLGLAIVFFKHFKRLNASTLLHGAVIGFIIFLAYLFQTIGIKYTTAGNNAFLTTLYVVLVPLILWIFTKRAPGIHIIVASVLAIIGIGFLSLQDDFFINKGDWLTILCSLGFALQMILIALYNQTDDVILLTILQIFFAAFFSWIVAPFAEGPIPLTALQEPVALQSILYLGIGSTLIGFLLQNLCQKFVSPPVVAIFLSLESLFGVIFAVIFLHEPFTLRMFIGCTLMFVAILLAETGFTFVPKLKKRKTDSKTTL